MKFRSVTSYVCGRSLFRKTRKMTEENINLSPLSRPPRITDIKAELDAARACVEALSTLCEASQKRTIEWLYEIFVTANFASFEKLKEDYEVLLSSIEKTQADLKKLEGKDQ